MRHLTFLLPLVLTLSAAPVLAQKNYQPGHLILENGEKKTGLIDYRIWERNPKKISFRSSADGPEEVYTVQQLKAFAVDGADVYTKAIVWKDDQPIRIDQLDAVSRPPVIDTVFLRGLVQGGKLALYELVDTKPHYFLLPEGDTLRELEFKRLLAGESGTSFSTLYTYRDQLKRYTAGAPGEEKVVRLIDRVPYNDKELSRVVILINGGTGTEVNKQESTIRTHQFFAGAGVARNNISFTGEKGALTVLSESPHTGYMATAGADLYSKRRFQNLFLRAEVRLSNSAYKGKHEGTNAISGETEKREYDLQMTNLSPSLSFNYSVLRLPDSRIYLGLGASYNFTAYTKNTYTTTYSPTSEPRVTDNYLDWEKQWFDVFGHAGFTVSERLDARLFYRIDGSFANFVNFGAKYNTAALLLAYRF